MKYLKEVLDNPSKYFFVFKNRSSNWPNIFGNNKQEI